MNQRQDLFWLTLVVSIHDATLRLVPPTATSYWLKMPPWRSACVEEARVAQFWRACAIPGERSARRVASGNSINSMAVAEKLIQSVYAYPVLYNVSYRDYCSSERRAKAWREVAASVGLSGQCVDITRAFGRAVFACEAFEFQTVTFDFDLLNAFDS